MTTRRAFVSAATAEVAISVVALAVLPAGMGPVWGANGNSSVPGNAQRAVLYEENLSHPPGGTYAGSVAWRTETVSPSTGRGPDLLVRADIMIPALPLAVSWVMRRNTDPSLPASYIIEITYSLPPSNSRGGIEQIPGLLMKDTDQGRGLPLTGLTITAKKGSFVFELSTDEVDLRNDFQLLRDEKWLSIPMIYANGTRAILVLPKGPSGELAFADAFKAWEQ